MSFDDGRRRLPGAAPAGPGLLGRIVGILFGIAALLLTLTVSVFVFAFVLVIGVIAAGYFWWKTRAVRAQMRAMRAQYARGEMGGMGNMGGRADGFPGGAPGRGPTEPPAGGGRVIEGEAVREDDPAPR